METSTQPTEPDPGEPPTVLDPDSEPSQGADEGRGLSPAATAVAAVAGVVAALVVIFVLFGGDDAESTIGGDGEFADLAFLTTDGATASLADFEGEPLVVNFFASWCAPCRAEMPDLEQVHQARGDEITFLGISHDLDESSWRSFVAETEVTFQTVYQPETELFTALEAKGMPSTALVAPSGEILYLHTGLLTDELLDELIDEHLGGA